MNVILHEPEIPSNTGNIGRTCCATGTSLHLIKPLGFSLSEKALKRAGMDYWDKLDVHVYTDFEDFLEKHPNATGLTMTCPMARMITLCSARSRRASRRRSS